MNDEGDDNVVDLASWRPATLDEVNTKLDELKRQISQTVASALAALESSGRTAMAAHAAYLELEARVSRLEVLLGVLDNA
jgi:hypothetical protein